MTENTETQPDTPASQDHDSGDSSSREHDVKDNAHEYNATVGWQSRAIFVIVTIIALGVLFWPKPDKDAAPNGKLRDAQGDKVVLKDVMAPVTVLHFWSTWCIPCRDEIPMIQRLAKDYADESDVEIVMVAVADDVDTVREFLGDDSSLFDNHWKVARKYGTEKLPETFLVVRGKLFERFVGTTDWDSALPRSRIKAALAAANRTAS